MCPACFTTLALIVVGATSTGGLAALVVKLHAKNGTKEIEPAIQTQGGQNESILSNEEYDESSQNCLPV